MTYLLFFVPCLIGLGMLGGSTGEKCRYVRTFFAPMHSLMSERYKNVCDILLWFCHDKIRQHTAEGRILLPSLEVGDAEQANIVGPMRGRFYREEDGVAEFCPAGTYGESVGLREEACSGVCPAGIVGVIREGA